MKLLVASITHDKEEYALDAVLDALKTQTHKDFDVLFVDNSTAEWYEERLRNALEQRFPERSTVLRATGEERFGRILASREAARAFALEERYTHVLFIDSDVLLPLDAIAEFIQADERLATGVYLNTFGEGDIGPCLFIEKGEGARRATTAEALSDEPFRIGAAGLGCTWVTRDLLAQVPFRLNTHGKGEDIMFYRDAVAHGAEPVALPISCAHLHFPVGDARNKPYDFARYRVRT